MSQPQGDGPQLVADLSAFSAADAIQWAQASQFSGRLAFRTEDVRVSLYFESSGIVQAASSRRIEAFGQHLFSEGLVDEIDLAAAIVHSRDSQIRIGDSMAALGLVDADTLRSSLHDHIVNLATLPVEWNRGWVQADQAPIENPTDLYPEAVDATFVLMEASRRVDDLSTFNREMASGEAILLPGGASLPGDAPGRWRRVLTTYEPNSTLRQHYERIGGSYFCFLDAAQELIGKKVFRLVAGSTQAAPELARETA